MLYSELIMIQSSAIARALSQAGVRAIQPMGYHGGQSKKDQQ
jgi:hypothetical protein